MPVYDFSKRGWWSGRTAIKNRPLDDALIAICEADPPRSYLEIGSREGGSLTAVLRHARPHPELIVCCDTWGNTRGGTGRGSHRHIDRVMDKEGYEGQRHFLDGPSQKLIPMLLLRDFSLVLIDGDHRAEPARKDVANAWPLVAPDGLMVIDDTNTERIRVLMDALVEGGGAEFIWRGNYGPGCGVVRKLAAGVEEPDEAIGDTFEDCEEEQTVEI